MEGFAHIRAVELLAALQHFSHTSVTQAAIQQEACVMLQGSGAPTHSLTAGRSARNNISASKKEFFNSNIYKIQIFSELLAFISLSVKIFFSQKKL